MPSPELPDEEKQDGDANGASLMAITRQYARYATVGIMFPVATALGFYLGYLVDGWFGSAPLFAIVGMVLGVVAAIRNLLQTVASDENG